MKISVIILFLSVILLRVFIGSIILLNYAINRDYIEKNFCINRFNPHSNCHGHCHLKKQLEEEEGSKNSSPANLPKDNVNDNWITEIICYVIFHQNHIIMDKKILENCTIGTYDLDKWILNRPP